MAGEFKKVNLKPVRVIREFRVSPEEEPAADTLHGSEESEKAAG